MSGLEQLFPGKVVTKNVDATTPESKVICRDLGFQNHGLVIRTADGTAVWKQPDHDVNIEDARAKLEQLLGGLD